MWHGIGIFSWNYYGVYFNIFTDRLFLMVYLLTDLLGYLFGSQNRIHSIIGHFVDSRFHIYILNFLFFNDCL